MTVGSGARVEAGGTINISAKHNEVIGGVFDGTFNAGNVDPSDPGDPDAGNSIVFSIAHNLTTGDVISYGYDSSGNLTSERDSAGNTVTRTYGGKNELLTETSYHDKDVVSGTEYVYEVTATDRALPPNESAPARTARDGY